jgi:hypothetical protein
MAIIREDDDLRSGLRGRCGDMVFRRVYGKTVMSRRPGKQNPAKETDAQKKTRSVFNEAAAWAMVIRRDPERKAYYQQLAKQWDFPNDYVAAIRDYMRNAAIATQYNAPAERGRDETPEGVTTASTPSSARRAAGQQPERSPDVLPGYLGRVKRNGLFEDHHPTQGFAAHHPTKYYDSAQWASITKPKSCHAWVELVSDA